MMDIGRPSIYTDEIADAICARIIAGEPLSEICGPQRDDGLPCERTVYSWLAIDNHPFLQKYVRARELQPWALDELLLAEAMKVLRGEQSFKAFGAVANCLQWKMSKMMPKRYGDRQQVELAGKDGQPMPPAITINFTDKRDGD